MLVTSKKRREAPLKASLFNYGARAICRRTQTSTQHVRAVSSKCFSAPKSGLFVLRRTRLDDQPPRSPTRPFECGTGTSAQSHSRRRLFFWSTYFLVVVLRATRRSIMDALIAIDRGPLALASWVAATVSLQIIKLIIQAN